MMTRTIWVLYDDNYGFFRVVAWQGIGGGGWDREIRWFEERPLIEVYVI